MSRDGRKLPVEVPPANWIALVVVLPAFVTVWRLAAVPDGQLVPFERQGAKPLIRSEVAEAEPREEKDSAIDVNVALEPVRFVMEPVPAVRFAAYSFVVVALTVVRFVPLAVPKPRIVEYKLPEVAEVNVARLAFKFEANKLVLVVFVPVALTHVMFWKFAGPVMPRFVNVAFVPKTFVEFRFVTVPEAALRSAV